MEAAAPSGPVARRSSWLEIDLGALLRNVGVIRSLVGPRVQVAPVIKANAYGHGLDAVGRCLDRVADALCVASLDEALSLRAAGVAGRILVLYPVPPPAVSEAWRARVEVAAMDEEDARALAAAAQADLPEDVLHTGGSASAPPTPSRMRVHLAVETGMSRGGLSLDRVAAAASYLARVPGIELAGLWSHLACPEDADASRAQLIKFRRAEELLREAGLTVPARHIAASGGLFAGTAPHLEMVRPGLAVYGLLDPDLPVAASSAAAARALAPALSLKARALAYSDVPTGAGVGYGARWRAARPSRVAILPVGYGDGFARSSVPGAAALVRGTRVPLVGAVSMDAVAADVTDVPGLSRADEYVLLGVQGAERITATELGRTRNTIAWEVLSGMAARLGRVYYPGSGTEDAGGDADAAERGGESGSGERHQGPPSRER